MFKSITIRSLMESLSTVVICHLWKQILGSPSASTMHGYCCNMYKSINKIQYFFFPTNQNIIVHCVVFFLISMCVCVCVLKRFRESHEPVIDVIILMLLETNEATFF